MVLKPDESDDPKTLRAIAATVLDVIKKRKWSSYEAFVKAFETCFQCHDLADRPPTDADRTAAVERLRRLSQRIISMTE